MEDLERNNGKDRPFFMTKELRKIMDVKNEESHPMEVNWKLETGSPIDYGKTRELSGNT